MKNDFICIVAGYKEEIDCCFFSYNRGLESRFPIRFEIEGYDYKELFLIFKQKINLIKWSLSKNITDKFFKEKMDCFKYYGRDIENLITQVKRCHSRRVFTLKSEEKTIITIGDLKNGLDIFLSFNKKKDNSIINSLYI